MADLKLELWEVLRLGTLQRALSGWDVELAALKGKIPNEGMVCVRYTLVEEGTSVILSVILDGTDMTTAQIIDEARKRVVSKRINID
ncbi:hypothetical protein [Reyranella sp.]|uniref:hypothetical protein n=1 Tax=Reyranella sp. TaxID=1929291 RepID=UPI00272F7AD6|nr:hypothetical protein [Reyranella sp.]MDP2378270.1 hypothetical protein [Reyranella sp.]